MKPTVKYSGGEWLERSVKEKLSPLAFKVADILGQVYQGIYHLSDIDHDKQEWKPVGGSRCVQVYLTRRDELATYDGSELTLLTLLCHQHAIRLAVSAERVVWVLEDPEDHESAKIHKFSDTNDDPDDDPDHSWSRPCLKLTFSQRSHGGDSCFSRHPTLDQAVETAKWVGEPLLAVDAPDEA